MRSNVLLFACAVVLAVVPAHAAEYKVDAVHATAMFSVSHNGISLTRGHFPDISGTVEFDELAAEDCSVAITVMTDSLTTLHEGRDKHLKGEDFFNVEKYPEMTFKSTSWKDAGDEQYEIAGDFTLLGVTKKVTFTADFLGFAKGRGGEALIGFDATFTIKRSDYGMMTYLGAIGDEVEITIGFEAAKQ